ncbi:MAG: 2,3,4,5-tetrahydropyridine-2,6-dicarboxylate N-succinyltransferase [Rickettsiaceae bacterium]|nr:2,3,4,5-tetrahydropyridine-2,6-dicarboxylate N-succinyltransferase [Rickettsiaceae bacterium]
MEKLIKLITDFWQIRNASNIDKQKLVATKDAINEIMELLNQGKIQVCQKQKDGIWQINEWLKKTILLYFKFTESQIYHGGDTMKWYDKVEPRFMQTTAEDFSAGKHRIVPGAYIRKGAYIGKNVVVMPSFINIGAYVGDNSLIDTWATIGSCAYIGNNCHISGGTGIGGVLEPLQAKPVIIEDNCFIGARSEIVEGVIVEEGSVISMGVFIGASTKIVYRDSGKVIYGRIPAGSVVVPGTFPADKPGMPSLYCAVIIKQVDKKTKEKTTLNELLRF